jgi:lambda family phage tail tape measure protein
LNSFLEKVLEISKEVGKINYSSLLPNSMIFGTKDIAEANANVTRLRKNVEEMQADIAANGGGFFKRTELETQLDILKQNEQVLTRLVKMTPIKLGEEFGDRVPSLLPPAPKVSDGTGAKSAWDSWIESIKKAGEEIDLIPRKMEYLAIALNKLKDAGQESSNAFKIMSEAYKKLNEEAGKGNVGVEIELQVQKIKDEASLAAEKFEYLAGAIAAAQDQGDTEGFMILAKMMQDLQVKTKDVATDFEKMTDGIADAIDRNANNAVNKFIDNIGNAQMSFADFATSVVKDIAKMVVQLLIMKPLIQSIKGFFPGGGVADYAFAQGGSFSGGTSLAQGIYNQPTLFKFAKGGTFGNTGLMGEAGPEAIVPLKRTSSGELGVQASPVNVIVNNNASGIEVQTQSSESSDGTKQIEIFIERKVKDGLANGAYDRIMRGSYGISRVGA